jgi:hypothetical protein
MIDLNPENHAPPFATELNIEDFQTVARRDAASEVADANDHVRLLSHPSRPVGFQY